jgi:hypothetical protein
MQTSQLGLTTECGCECSLPDEVADFACAEVAVVTTRRLGPLPPLLGLLKDEAKSRQRREINPAYVPPLWTR